jgi:oligopeptidase B
MKKSSTTKTQPPVAKKIEHITKLHGLTLKDNYFWLREKENPEVIAYLEAENEYSSAWVRQHKKLENKIFQEIISKIRETDESPHFQIGTYMYGVEIKKGQQYAKHFRYPVGKPDQKRIYFNENHEAKGSEFFSLGGSSISPNQNLLAYVTDKVGFRQYKLYVRDLNTGEDSELIADKVGSFAWSADSKTLLYTVEDHAKRQHKVLSYTLGTEPNLAKTIFEEKDERFYVGVGLSLDKQTLYIVSGSHTTTEMYFAPSDLSKKFKSILPRKDNVEYGAERRGDTFLILTNDESPSFRLASLPMKNIGKWSSLKTFMQPQGGAVFTNFSLFANHLIINERSNGLEQILVHSFSDQSTKPIKFPEPTYSLRSSQNMVFDTNKFRFSYNSMVTPQSVYDVDLSTLELTLIKESTPPGKYNKADYHTDRVMITARDGTKVPVSFVYKKSLFKPGKSPSLIGAYGSYGFPSDASFDASAFPLLDRGFIVATAHIRGGGEYGKPWHDSGKMKNKMNTFTDFIDTTKELIEQKIISAENIFIEGGSAGGLLMGAVSNLEPALFRGVLSHVPFVDVINSMLDETMPLTVGEFEEWGNPKIKADFEYMYTYSPYDNITAKDYPAMWIRTGLHDSQVMYWEPAKYTAKLRALKTDTNPLYLLVNMKSGHGGSSGRYDAYRERAQDYVFVLETMKKPKPSKK